MALGTPTINAIRETRDGGQELLMSFDGDDNYPTGGTTDFNAYVRDAVKTAHAAAADANIRGEERVAALAVVPQNCGQYVPSYDYANDTLFVRDGGHATWQQVPNTTDLSGTTFNVLVVCK